MHTYFYSLLSTKTIKKKEEKDTIKMLLEAVHKPRLQNKRGYKSYTACLLRSRSKIGPLQ